MGARNTVVYAIASSVLLLLITTAHFHPGTDFQLPLLPSSWDHFEPHIPDAVTAENRLLTAQECLDRYPDLYKEADRARSYYEARGGITAEMVDDAEKADASARLMILDNRVCSVCLVRPSKSRSDN